MIKALAIDTIIGMHILHPLPRNDARGYFVETYRKDELTAQGITDDFVQHNETLSLKKGIVRGFHFQVPGYNRIARVTHGSIIFAAVDVRPGSPTFKNTFQTILDAASLSQLYIPAGVAWAFMTREDNTQMQYISSKTYAEGADRTLHFEKVPGVHWPEDIRFIVSDRDAAGVSLEEWLASPEAAKLNYA